jgi:hypothetical protein
LRQQWRPAVLYLYQRSSSNKTGSRAPTAVLQKRGVIKDTCNAQTTLSIRISEYSGDIQSSNRNSEIHEGFQRGF